MRSTDHLEPIVMDALLSDMLDREFGSSPLLPDGEPVRIQQSTPQLAESKSEEKSYPWSPNSQYVIGIGRDFSWAVFTLMNYSFLPQLGVLWGAWVSQLIIGLAGILAATSLVLAVDAAREQPQFQNTRGAFVLFTYGLASFLAVIPWNFAQILGLELANKDGYSGDKADYFSALIPGPFEMAVQSLVVMGLSAAVDKNERENFKGLRKLSQRGVDLLTGIPGGSMWQLIAKAGSAWMLVESGLAPLLVSSAGVAVGVAFTSYLCGKLAAFINKKIQAVPATEPDLESYGQLPQQASVKNSCYRLFACRSAKAPANDVSIRLDAPRVVVG